MAKFNGGETQSVWHIKMKVEINNCSKGCVKQKLRKLEINTAVKLLGVVCTCCLEWFVYARARTLVQEHAKEVNKIWEKVNLWHIMDDWDVSEIDVRFCVV
jgi:hypothetical protein